MKKIGKIFNTINNDSSALRKIVNKHVKVNLDFRCSEPICTERKED
jgi:hypothetical protein